MGALVDRPIFSIDVRNSMVNSIVVKNDVLHFWAAHGGGRRRQRRGGQQRVSKLRWSWQKRKKIKKGGGL